MPSIVRSMAVAAFASFAAAQYSNGTAPAAVSVPGWAYQGCAIATAATGSLIDSSPFMTVERCLLAASAYSFARIQGNNCYGAQSTNGTNPVPELSCNTRCPGNAAQACGGSAGVLKRQAAGTTVSVYARIPSSQITAGTIYNIQINNIFVDYCAACVNGLGGTTTRTFVSVATLTACGCPTQATPSVPVTTVVTTALVQNTATVLTLTVPAGVAVGVATGATVTAPVTTIVACNTCPAASTATVGTSTITVPANSALATVTACPGCVPGAGSVATTATAVVVVAPTTAAATTTRSAQFTGAASMEKASFGLLALGAAAALL